MSSKKEAVLTYQEHLAELVAPGRILDFNAYTVPGCSSQGHGADVRLPVKVNNGTFIAISSARGQFSSKRPVSGTGRQVSYSVYCLYLTWLQEASTRTVNFPFEVPEVIGAMLKFIYTLKLDVETRRSPHTQQRSPALDRIPIVCLLRKIWSLISESESPDEFQACVPGEHIRVR